MSPRKYARGSRRPLRRRPIRPRGGGGGKKGSVCSFSLPSAVAATLVVLAQLALVRWQTGGAR